MRADPPRGREVHRASSTERDKFAGLVGIDRVREVGDVQRMTPNLQLIGFVVLVALGGLAVTRPVARSPINKRTVAPAMFGERAL